MEFNSQICTTVEQSKRLLALGLKKETADCMYSAMTKEYNGRYILEEDRQYNLCLFYQEEVQSVGFEAYEHIPAWSLHRLICLMRKKSTIQLVPIDDAFDKLIEGFKSRLKDGYINPEYLEENEKEEEERSLYNQ